MFSANSRIINVTSLSAIQVLLWWFSLCFCYAMLSPKYAFGLPFSKLLDPSSRTCRIFLRRRWNFGPGPRSDWFGQTSANAVSRTASKEGSAKSKKQPIWKFLGDLNTCQQKAGSEALHPRARGLRERESAKSKQTAGAQLPPQSDPSANTFHSEITARVRDVAWFTEIIDLFKRRHAEREKSQAKFIYWVKSPAQPTLWQASFFFWRDASAKLH